MRTLLRAAGIMLLFAVIVVFVLMIFLHPSHDRNWSPDQAVLPTVEVDEDRVFVRNVRHSVYRSKDDYDVAYEDRSYDLSQIRRVWYIVEPFNGWPGSAHTFLSFEFEGPEYLALSAEIRKEKGESFSAWKGLFRQYELMYVYGDERDLVLLRTNHRKDQVYLYPMRATPDQVRKIFLSIADRVNGIAGTPEFYHTIWNTCTSNIVDHINAIVPDRIPWHWSMVLPAFSDRYAYDLGLIDTDLPFDEAREHFLITDRAQEGGDDPAFSGKIREFDAQKP